LSHRPLNWKSGSHHFNFFASCGFNVPSKANDAAFERAVEAVAASARVLMRELVTNAEPRNREMEAAKARAASLVRFGR
jgi:hypothetical protein